MPSAFVIYVAAKAAVVTISETLRGELAQENIGVSVLCPGPVNTNIHELSKNRPPQFGVGDAFRAAEEADDQEDEGQPPDHSLVINGLDEKQIKDWWQIFGLSRDGVQYYGPLQPWETLRQNCSTVVARGLSIGGGDRYASWTRSRHIVWTPNDVLQYALSIRRGLAAARHWRPAAGQR